MKLELVKLVKLEHVKLIKLELVKFVKHENVNDFYRPKKMVIMVQRKEGEGLKIRGMGVGGLGGVLNNPS